MPSRSDEIYRRMGKPHPSHGYWVDMPNAYITYDNRYIETVWWLLGQLYEKAISTRVTPSSPILRQQVRVSAPTNLTSRDVTET